MTSTVQRIRLCWFEARPIVQLIFLLGFAAGVVLCCHADVPFARVSAGAAGWCVATFAVYVCNGVADRAQDVANGSTRPIARGGLSVRFASVAAVLGAAAGCAVAGWLGPWTLAAMAGFLVLGYAYSGPHFPFKRTYCSASIGGGLGLLTYLGGALSTARPPGSGVLVFGVMMSLWMGAAGGIAKDFSDVVGDRAAGRRTWPVMFGERRARRLLMMAALAVAAAFSLTAAVYSERLSWCAAAVCLGAAAVVPACVRPSQGRGRAGRLPCRPFMRTQYLNNAVLAGVILAPVHM
jgi:4-hydroxybenzoate polyprenyltransferase